MIVVKIKGGLGNQMFQYAMARKIQLELGIERIGLDVVRVNADQLRDFSLAHFRLNDCVSVLEENAARKVTKMQEDLAKRLVSYFVAGRPEEIAAAREKKMEKFFHLLGIIQKDHDTGIKAGLLLKAHRNIFMNGWFQDAMAMESIRDILLEDFENAEEMPQEIKNTAMQIEQNESVCVHIRRGDYVNHPQFGVCTEEYYLNAMHRMAERLEHPVFYLFSDNIEEVKVMPFPYPVVFDHPGHDNFESMYLMSKCRHFIISNSTFSWWGQFLSDNGNKIVMAPERWCNYGNGYTALYSDRWTLLPV